MFIIKLCLIIYKFYQIIITLLDGLYNIFKILINSLEGRLLKQIIKNLINPYCNILFSKIIAILNSLMLFKTLATITSFY